MAYYRKRFEKCKNTIMDTWVAINAVIRRNNRTNLPEIFKINGKSVKDNQIIADEFKAFFSKIGSKLASEINRNTKVNYAQFLLTNPCLLNIALRYRPSPFSMSLTSCPQKQVGDTTVYLQSYFHGDTADGGLGLVCSVHWCRDSS